MRIILYTGKGDPTRLHYTGVPQKVVKQGKRYILTLALPFVDKEDIEVLQTRAELVVRVGTYKRNIVLPNTLAGLDARDARLEEGKLRVLFTAPSKS